MGALNGTLAVESPPNGGTRVRATIPLAQPEEATTLVQAPSGVPVLPDEQAAKVQHDRLHRVRLRAFSLGIVAAVLVAIWALTDPGLPWIAWPLLALGFIAALDAWRAYSLQPLRESDLAGAEEGEAGLRRLVTRRRLRHSAGSLAILNVFLIGVWIASGSSYFWPVWVMLGSALALAIKALPRPGGVQRDPLGEVP